MKKIINLLSVLFTSAILCGCATSTNSNQAVIVDNLTEAIVSETELSAVGTQTNPQNEIGRTNKHLILNKDGSYGGTLDENKYGIGAPLNGQYDQTNSGYYTANDYYNMQSTTTRTIFSRFAPYQQTMAKSSGLACALMIMNYCLEDVQSECSELALVEKYQELNNKNVYENDTTVAGLEKLFNNYGYVTRTTDYNETGNDTTSKIAAFNAWVYKHLRNGRFIMVRFQDGMDFGWHIIIGMDTMGTDYAKNNVLIMADPFDNLDHCQDGYSISPSGRFYRWWLNAEKSGSISNEFDYIVVAPKMLIEPVRANEETVPTKDVPDLHLLLNKDGSYGGTTNAELYGAIPEKNGETDILNSIYYEFPDYYNMTSSTSRTILPHYRAYQQTMASSCGISSVLSVLNFYGEDVVNEKNEVALVNKYETINGTTVKGSGIGSSGIKKMVESYNYTGTASYYASSKYVDEKSMTYPTYASFLSWVKDNLSQGVPMPVSMRPMNGHWETIIGIDTMGTDYCYDDVLILADSHDTWDHYQDGYNTYSATLFYRQWYNGGFTYNQQNAPFYKKTA